MAAHPVSDHSASSGPGNLSQESRPPDMCIATAVNRKGKTGNDALGSGLPYHSNSQGQSNTLVVAFEPSDETTTADDISTTRSTEEDSQIGGCSNQRLEHDDISHISTSSQDQDKLEKHGEPLGEPVHSTDWMGARTWARAARPNSRVSASSHSQNFTLARTIHGEAITFKAFLRYCGNSEDDWDVGADSFSLSLPRGGKLRLERPKAMNEELVVVSEISRKPSFLTALWGSRSTMGQCSPKSLSQEDCWQLAERQWVDWFEFPIKLPIARSRGWPQLFIFSDKNRDIFLYRGWDPIHALQHTEKDVVKVWTLEQEPLSPLGPQQLSIAYHILHNCDFPQYETLLKDAAACLVRQHIGPWQPIDLFCQSACQLPHAQYGKFLFHYRLHMFTVGNDKIDFDALGEVSHCRAKGRFPANKATADSPMSESSWFYERRISMLMIDNSTSDPGTILLMYDNRGGGFSPQWVKLRSNEAGKIDEPTPRKGARILHSLIRHYYVEWERAWHGCLDRIDAAVKITLEDVSDDMKLDRLMFDGPKFERSRSYFATLQLLRIFSDHIKETRRDVEWIIDKIDMEKQELLNEWKETLNHLKSAEERLLQRIDTKTEDIKTLRDGLFNSTAVREATRSTEMNRYIIVFTIVTVIYAPPSFISALFATPLPYFTKGDTEEFKKAIGIATGTTVLAALILLGMANSFGDIFQALRNFLRPRIHLLLRMFQQEITERFQRETLVLARSVAGAFDSSMHALRNFFRWKAYEVEPQVQLRPLEQQKKRIMSAREEYDNKGGTAQGSRHLNNGHSSREPGYNIV
ncbi:hypothetical protein F4803DRAFT_243147 [Xylaria telfairii]|nr:hypothetical protein F4803DRAFT_243147 [Xylaria telfairii]